LRDLEGTYSLGALRVLAFRGDCPSVETESHEDDSPHYEEDRDTPTPLVVSVVKILVASSILIAQESQLMPGSSHQEVC